MFIQLLIYDRVMSNYKPRLVNFNQVVQVEDNHSCVQLHMVGGEILQANIRYPQLLGMLVS